MLGGDATDDADAVDPLSRSCSSSAAKSAPRIASPSIPSCLAIAAPVTTSSPVTIRTRMCALWASCDRLLGLGARRVDHPDQARHLEPLDVGQQIAVGVERRRIEVTEAGRHHPQPVLLHPLDVLLRAGAQIVVPGDALPGRQRASPRDPCTAGAAPLTKQRTTSCPDASNVVGEHRHQLVGRVERQRRHARVALARAVEVEPGLVAEDQQRALGRIADHLAVDELRIARDHVRQDRVLDRVRGARGVLDA